MEDSKVFWKSTTFWGVAISVVGKVLFLLGFDVGPLEGVDLLIASMIGDAEALWGRIRATKKLSLK